MQDNSTIRCSGSNLGCNSTFAAFMLEFGIQLNFCCVLLNIRKTTQLLLRSAFGFGWQVELCQVPVSNLRKVNEVSDRKTTHRSCVPNVGRVEKSAFLRSCRKRETKKTNAAILAIKNVFKLRFLEKEGRVRSPVPTERSDHVIVPLPTAPTEA